MADRFLPSKQRPALLAFAEACDTRPNALRRDDCGDWAIFGNNGHIYAVPEGFQFMIGCDVGNRGFSKTAWTWAKKRLAFGKVTQDGDEEGSIILDRLPSKAEAMEIRDVLGIPKRFDLTEECREERRERGRNSPLFAGKPASGDEGATEAPEVPEFAIVGGNGVITREHPDGRR
jgi:hypothetical protein